MQMDDDEGVGGVQEQILGVVSGDEQRPWSASSVVVMSKRLPLYRKRVVPRAPGRIDPFMSPSNLRAFDRHVDDIEMDLHLLLRSDTPRRPNSA